ncbi:hypothetical protein E5288_WYG004278 [Bos mutus]|uniref:Uncharacterized protein n=1 Tax=Bos mutus TaxID=72004 RepID=A0A6B0RC58_9CETA|nr:hypothetical protein [Bos mutus]
MWGMRKACAECFLAVAHNTSPEVCRSRLWPLFITLISDPCRWPGPPADLTTVGRAFRSQDISKHGCGNSAEVLFKQWKCTGIQFHRELIPRFRHCSKWVGRQAFAFICQAVVSKECIPMDQSVEHILPSLLSLISNPVPNERVLLAKALRQILLEKAYFRNAGNPHLGVSEETVLALLSDQNQDLTFFAALEPKRGNVTDPRHAARTELTHL